MCYYCPSRHENRSFETMTMKTTSALSSHDRILLAAKRLFAKDGYENTSTVAIAREAGTSESQLMKHFGSKQGLLVAIFDGAGSALANGSKRFPTVPLPTVCWLFSRPLQLNWKTILTRKP